MFSCVTKDLFLNLLSSREPLGDKCSTGQVKDTTIHKEGNICDVKHEMILILLHEGNAYQTCSGIYFLLIM